MLSPTFVSQVLNIFLLFGTVFAIGLGIFVWWQNRKSLHHIIFGLMNLSLATWLAGTYMMLRNCAIESWVVFWDRFLYLGVVFIPMFMYHFVVELVGKTKEKTHKTLLYIGYIIAFLFLFLLLSRTDYFIKDVFQYKWGCHTTAQAGHHLFLLYFFFYTLVFFYLLINCWKTTRNPVLKIQTKNVFISFLLFYIAAVEYLPAYQIGVFPFGYFFTLVGFIVLAYVVVRHQLLNIKVIATDILVGAITFVILVFTILSESTIQFIGRGVFLILVIIFGWLAIRGVHREVEEKERLEEKVKERTKELETSKNIAEERAKEIGKRKEDLEKFYKLTVGRELRMVELKKQIKELEEKIKDEKE